MATPGEQLDARVAELEDEVRFLKGVIKAAQSNLCPPDTFCECGCGRSAFSYIAHQMSKRYTGLPANKSKQYGEAHRRRWNAPLPLPG